MKKILSNPLIITILFFVLLMLFGLFVSTFVVRDRLDHVVYGSRFVQIEGEYTGNIYPKHDDLNKIKIHLKNPGLENTGRILIQIIDGGSILREIELNGRNVGDPGDLNIQFDKIHNSSGKTYLVRLVVDDTRPNLEIYSDEEESISGWFYYRDDKYLNTLTKTVGVLLGRILQDKVMLLLWGSSVFILTVVYFIKRK